MRAINNSFSSFPQLI